MSLPIKIAGLGRYLPERVVPSIELDRLCGVEPGWTEKHTGVRERRWVTTETATEMAAHAAREAVADAGLALDDIDLIINASGTPEQVIPEGGPLIQGHLGLSGAPCFTVDATCLSFVAGLRVAAGMLSTGYARVLVVSSDCGSAALNFDEPESAGLMGDAAAAAVLVHSDDTSAFHEMRLETYHEGASFTEIRGGGSRRHPADPSTTREDNLFTMNGPKTLRLARRVLPQFLERLRPGLTSGLGSVDVVVPHQASSVGLRLLRYYGWPEEHMVYTLSWTGNCIAAAIPSALYEGVRCEQIKRGDEVLLLGTGAGMSLGAVILTY